VTKKVTFGKDGRKVGDDPFTAIDPEWRVRRVRQVRYVHAVPAPKAHAGPEATAVEERRRLESVAS